MSFTVDTNHWLTPVKKAELPGGSAMNIRRFLVIHFTGGWSAKSSIDYWRQLNNGVCAHLVIDRDGTVYQCRPFNRTCGHAGASKWRDPKTGVLYSGLNSCSIGIELANCGDLARETYPKGMGRLTGQPIPRVRAAHKNGGPVKLWEYFPSEQVNSLIAVSQCLVRRYNLDDVIGHDDIAPDRKNDPGPALDMGRLRVACGFPKAIPKLK